MNFYRKVFVNLHGIQVFKEPNELYFSNHWLSYILIDKHLSNGLTPEKIKQAFDLENIETRPLWKPMHLQPVFEKMPYYGEKVAENLFKN